MKTRRFLRFQLDSEGLTTPDGVVPASSVTEAKLERNYVTDSYSATTSPSATATVGGALAGGAIAGPLGAAAGGLLGSNVKNVRPGEEVRRTVSATLRISTADRTWTADVALDRIPDAEAFATAVRKAAGLE
ncbi:MAG: hypothetical protein HY876_02815 [Coriobacteriales bacterium]|nr:hypothetical protein [Coriobacteriales bacterium]